LPDASDEGFYGSVAGNMAGKDVNEAAPFQQMMKRVGSGGIRNVYLKQVGKELTLQFTHVLPDGTKERLEDAKRRVEEIAALGSISI